MTTITFFITTFLAGIITSLLAVQLPKAAFKQWEADAKDYLNIKDKKPNEQAEASVWGLKLFITEFSLQKQRHLLIGSFFLVACIPIWLALPNLLTTSLMCGVISCLFIGALVDWEHMYIPDETIVFGLGFTFIYLIIQGGNLESHILGAMLGYGFIALLRWLFYLLRGVEGIGLGDAKMLALIGSLIGVTNIFLSIIIACVIAIFLNLRSKKQQSKEIPFGPGIAISGLIFYYIKLFAS